MLFVTRVILFWKSRFAVDYYNRHPDFKSWYLYEHIYTYIWYIPENTSCMLGCTFPGWHSTNLIDRFWKFYFFRILWAKMCQKMAAILDFYRFLPIKSEKNKIFKICQSDLWNVSQGRYMQNFSILACKVFSGMYLTCSYRYCDLKSGRL